MCKSKEILCTIEDLDLIKHNLLIKMRDANNSIINVKMLGNDSETYLNLIESFEALYDCFYLKNKNEILYQDDIKCFHNSHYYYEQLIKDPDIKKTIKFYKKWCEENLYYQKGDFYIPDAKDYYTLRLFGTFRFAINKNKKPALCIITMFILCIILYNYLDFEGKLTEIEYYKDIFQKHIL